jgi:ketosteroid isomerase-like protein
MKFLLSILFVTVWHLTFSQTAAEEINAQVWKPFIEAFNNHDTEKFMAVHSKDVVRAPRDAKAVWNWQKYYSQQETGDKREITAKMKRDLALRFTERIQEDDHAVEVGIYKTTMTDTNGRVQSFYGRFHVVLRKEQGTWKILVDTDSSEGRKISEQDFLAAQEM